MAWQRVNTKRALLSCLGPLAGPRATGTVTATASGAAVELPAGTYGIPLIDGDFIHARMVKTLPTGRDANGDPIGTTITSSGTSVAVRAVAGGPSGNLPAGTVILWQPPTVGVAARGVVATGGITGGTNTPGPGVAARVVTFESLGAGATVRNFWEAKGDGFPAVLIARVGSSVDQITRINEALRSHRFRVYVVTARQEGDDERVEEAEHLLDAIESILQGIADVDGEVFSGPPVETGEEAREQSAPNATVFSLACTVHYALPRQDVREGDGESWATWATTRIRVAAPETDALVARTLVDIKAEET